MRKDILTVKKAIELLREMPEDAAIGRTDNFGNLVPFMGLSVVLDWKNATSSFPREVDYVSFANVLEPKVGRGKAVEIW